MSILSTVFIALATGLFGALVSSWVYVWREKRMFKIQTLKKFAAHRYDVTGDKFSEAINEIFIVFNDSPDVMKALEVVHSNATKKDREKNADDGFVRLFKAMCSDTNTKYDHFNDSFFLKPFNAKPGKIQEG